MAKATKQDESNVDSGGVRLRDPAEGRSSVGTNVYPLTELMPADLPATGDPTAQLRLLADKFREALVHDPGNRSIRLQLANVLADLGALEAAITEYDAILHENGMDGEAMHFRGTAKARLGDFEGATKDYDYSSRRGANHEWLAIDQAWLWATCPQMTVRDGSKGMTAVLTHAGEKKYICAVAALATKADFDLAAEYLKLAKKHANRFHDLIATLSLSLAARQPYWHAFEAPANRFARLTLSQKSREKVSVGPKSTIKPDSNLAGSTFPSRGDAGLDQEQARLVAAATFLQQDERQAVAFYCQLLQSLPPDKLGPVVANVAAIIDEKVDSTFPTRFGDAVRRLRNKEPQPEFAARAGLLQPNLSDIERGVYHPKLATIQRIARALKMSVLDVLAEVEPTRRSKKSR